MPVLELAKRGLETEDRDSEKCTNYQKNNFRKSGEHKGI